MASDLFYLCHGANAKCGNIARVRAKRASIKVYVQRIRGQIGKALLKAGLKMSPESILLSELTDSNSVVYKVKIIVEFRHT